LSVLRRNNFFWRNGEHDDLLLLPRKQRLETAIALMALDFNMFVYAVKIDTSVMWRAEKKPIIIGLASLVISVITGVIASYILYNNIRSFIIHKEKFVFFIAILHSHSACIVLSDILSEFGILSSELGRLALSSSMVQFETGMVFIVLFTIVDQSRHGGMMRVFITATLLLVLFAFIIFVVRPYGLWITQDTRSNGYIRYIT
jgi:Kef-type K+ transport system membrane component KefB